MHRRLAAALLAAITLLSVGSLTAGAQELPPVPAVPDTDSDTGGHETQNPAGPDHASGSAWEITSTNDQGEQEEFLTIGRTHAEMDEDGANRSKATGLSVAGNEVVGASSQARNSSAESQSVGGPTCIGLICFGVAYARTTNQDGPTGSKATAEGGVAAVCVGPEETLIVPLDADMGPREYAVLEQTCLVEMQALWSYSSVEQDKPSGETRSSSMSVPLLICGDGILVEIGGCLGAISFSNSRTQGSGDGATERYSAFFFSQENGETEVFDDNETFWGDLVAGDAGDGECPEDIGFGYCAHFNQGESFMFPRGAASRQEAMHAVGFSRGMMFGNFHMGTVETLARVLPDTVLPEVIRRETVARLALTGGSVQALGAIAIAFLLIGAMVLAGTRRRTT